MDDNNVTLQEKYPTEVIELPSKGYFYDENNILSSGKITLRQPTAKHEDILTSKNLITKGIVIDEFLKSLIVEKIDYDSMLLCDKNALIIASRILLYGPDYKTQVKCQSCGTSQVKSFNLTELEIKNIDFSAFERGVNEFSYTLPISKIPIKIKLLTNKDEYDINSMIKLKNKNNLSSVDSEITTRLSHIIIEWNGERSKSKIMKYVSDYLLSRDSYYLRKFILSITPGINTDVNFVCNSPECGYEDIITLPMDINFFWPTGRLQE